MGKPSYHVPYGKRATKELLEELPGIKKYAKVIFSRLTRVTTMPEYAKILDVGASVGRFVIACNQLGYLCEGVDPNKMALSKAKELSKQIGISIPVVDGKAESLPYENNTFDVVIAKSVVEHILDVEKAFEEIYRVLKNGGIFWFNSASSMCPMQSEIKGFPLFGWYPNSLKLKIMDWAKNKKPYLIGYADAPAINWFTPSKAHKLLTRYGFKKVYDRWDLRGENEYGRKYGLALRAIRATKLSKTLADIVVPGCSYAAIK